MSFNRKIFATIQDCQGERSGTASPPYDGCEGVLQEYNRLRTGNVKAATTAFTCQHIVNAYHIVARLLKAHAILLISPSRSRLLLGALEPADVIFPAFAAVGATVGRLLGFLFLVEEVLFVHSHPKV